MNEQLIYIFLEVLLLGEDSACEILEVVFECCNVFGFGSSSRTGNSVTLTYLGGKLRI